MEFKMIKSLLLSVQGFVGDPGFNYEVLKGAQVSAGQLDKQLEKAGINAQNRTAELDDAINLMSIEYERQGFVNGFRMGVQLMRECTCQVTGGEAG